MAQKQVNKKLAVGMVGEFYDNSPKRVTTYKGFGVKAEKATGVFTATGNVSANETVVVGVQTYTFKEKPNNPYEVAVGADIETSLGNLADAINGVLQGTPENVFVEAIPTATTISLFAKEKGTKGNSVATTTTCQNASFGSSTLLGGVDGVNAKIGVAYTSTDNNAEAVIGGNGIFLGIAINPKEYTRFDNLKATLEIPNGTAVQLCSFGRIFVQVSDSISVGQTAFFNKLTGEIKGATAGSSVEGFTEIKNSKFIIQDALATEVAVLELGN